MIIVENVFAVSALGVLQSLGTVSEVSVFQVAVSLSSDRSILEIIEQNKGMRILKKPFALDDLKELMEKHYN